jgi:inner membrane protein
MRRINHFSWSFALSLWLFFYIFKYEIFISFLLSLLVAFLSFLPDLDIILIKKVDRFNRENFYIFFLFVYIFKSIFKHRTVTHSIWIPFVLFYFAEYFFLNFYLVIFLRVIYLSLILHILEDSCTVSGVRIFYPLNFNLRFFKFSTNSTIHFYFLEILAYFVAFLFVLSLL